MQKFLKNILSWKLIFIVLACLVLGRNIRSLAKLHHKIVFINKNLVFAEPGREFADLADDLQGVEKVGFLTDKDMSPEKNDGLFLQAQYRLAPTVLDLGNAQHPLLIFDCQNVLTAFDMMKELNAAPLHVNPYFKILAERQ
ncbi:MAG: hypothetical protein A2787_02290 [Omnitrophica WOR_2 bacterium RIFCSPHIGHO2_01_FULL_48_9]|nr:MAG: hypothetical protein A3D10_02085 [Omnitrophica WOR_2 bacterium RIFCSPHIGHO2_02_FULL_48_11]OGX30097.1 MAG: hypothetical protein A2787_02290 [Omnitrophica WOR_2 bacterium RIFCSPHIGHO2_01_FULL_48_9]